MPSDTAKRYRNISVFDKRPYHTNVIDVSEDVTAMRAHVYVLSAELFGCGQRLINVVGWTKEIKSHRGKRTKKYQQQYRSTIAVGILFIVKLDIEILFK